MVSAFLSDFKAKFSVAKKCYRNWLQTFIWIHIFHPLESWMFYWKWSLWSNWTTVLEDTITIFKDRRRHTVHEVQWVTIETEEVEWKLLGVRRDRNRDSMINMSEFEWEKMKKLWEKSYLQGSTVWEYRCTGLILNSPAVIFKDTKRSK